VLSEIEIALIATLIRLWRKGTRFLSSALKVLFIIKLVFSGMCGGECAEHNNKVIFGKFF